ncbi:MAG: hypothetical protein R2761_22640 [Acidimicrobiales bacterium]
MSEFRGGPGAPGLFRGDDGWVVDVDALVDLPLPARTEDRLRRALRSALDEPTIGDSVWEAGLARVGVDAAPDRSPVPPPPPGRGAAGVVIRAVAAAAVIVVGVLLVSRFTGGDGDTRLEVVSPATDQRPAPAPGSPVVPPEARPDAGVAEPGAAVDLDRFEWIADASGSIAILVPTAWSERRVEREPKTGAPYLAAAPSLPRYYDAFGPGVAVSLVADDPFLRDPADLLVYSDPSELSATCTPAGGREIETPYEGQSAVFTDCSSSGPLVVNVVLVDRVLNQWAQVIIQAPPDLSTADIEAMVWSVRIGPDRVACTLAGTC